MFLCSRFRLLLQRGPFTQHLGSALFQPEFRSYSGVLTVKVVIRFEDRFAGELNFLYVFLFLKLSQN